jgi:hypothetical protein
MSNLTNNNNNDEINIIPPISSNPNLIMPNFVNSDEVLHKFGCDFNDGKFTLKIGTLYLSKGNLTKIKTNIQEQITKRIEEFDLEYIHCVKFCVPVFGPKTKLGIEQSCAEIFVGLSELYIDTKPEYPGIYFVKVIFPKPIEFHKNIFHLGNLRESSGSVGNIKKNIKSQFEKMVSTIITHIQPDTTGIIRCTIPIYSPDTKLAINEFLSEKYPDSKHRILRLTSGIFMVDVFLK